ncbi:hypothetical protein [Lactiplantibacillus plantarum]|uniref:hypothetical protein n=1 Tax=Lactiplantibacillus plantarum TaxID=1590 RepID=UPI002000877A|nr:hypothetical protein [Lactiplantibacillus plantarum]
MNYNFKKNVNNAVTVTQDEHVIRRARPRPIRKDKHQTSMREGGLNTVQTMGLESALSKDERLFRLKVAIQKEKVKTVTAASKLMGVSPNTIRTYMRDLNRREPELHIQLLDDQKGKIIG